MIKNAIAPIVQFTRKILFNEILRKYYYLPPHLKIYEEHIE